MGEPTILIGMAGYARSGKDTVADMLVKQHNFVKVSFADALKSGIVSMLGLTENQLHGSEKEQELAWLGCSPRHIMQTLGTEWGRKLVHPNLWVLIVERHIKVLVSAGLNKIVISDVRFPNEAEFVKRMGVLVRIDRPGVGPINGHCSEDVTLIDPYVDATLVNDGTFEQLEDKVINLVAATMHLSKKANRCQ